MVHLVYLSIWCMNYWYNVNLKLFILQIDCFVIHLFYCIYLWLFQGQFLYQIFFINIFLHSNIFIFCYLNQKLFYIYINWHGVSGSIDAASTPYINNYKQKIQNHVHSNIDKPTNNNRAYQLLYKIKRTIRSIFLKSILSTIKVLSI